METAVRLRLNLVVLILQDDAYGMIRWKQAVDGFPDFGMTFGNPDFVTYAKALHAKGSRVETAEALVPSLEAAFQERGVHLIAVPIDYAENIRVLVDELRSGTLELRGGCTMIKVVQAFDRMPLAEVADDQEVALERKLDTAAYHAGQVCVSTQRIYVHADIECAFLDRFAARVAALRVGDPVLAETEVGPLIHPREADRVSGWIEEASAGGASVIGGGRITDTTLLPAIIVNPPAEAKLSTQEVFGPVTCVSHFIKLDEAIAAANALPMAFQASVFTEDLRSALRAAERLDASAVMINDHTAFRTDWMPFAGRRQSGYGVGEGHPCHHACHHRGKDDSLQGVGAASR